jgi:extracellular matrix regulatory protein A
MSNIALNVGFYNYVMTSKVVAIVSSDSAPMRRVVQEYRKTSRLIDATQGRKTKTVIFLEGGQVATSALTQDILHRRLLADGELGADVMAAEEGQSESETDD